MGTVKRNKSRSNSKSRRTSSANRKGTSTRTKLKEKVRRIVQGAPGPITVADIGEEIGRKPEHVYRVVEALQRDGHVRRFKKDGVYHVAPSSAPLPADAGVSEREIDEALSLLRRAGVVTAELDTDGHWNIKRQTLQTERR